MGSLRSLRKKDEIIEKEISTDDPIKKIGYLTSEEVEELLRLVGELTAVRVISKKTAEEILLAIDTRN